MAIIGQCKACGRAVSDEAVICPKCGQPRPCLLFPSVGTVHQGRVTSAMYYIGDSHAYDATLSSGVSGTFYVSDKEANRFRVGDSVSVKIKDVDKEFGRVYLSLER